MHDATQILTRHPANPIIQPRDLPGAMAIFNPSPVLHDGQTVLLLSVYEFKRRTRRAYGTWVARSDDGVNFSIQPDPLIDLSNAPAPFDQLSCTMIDNRITPIDGSYYMMTPAFTEHEGPFVLLGKTDDFRRYEPIELVSLPPNRGASMFPEKINGKYMRLDRPGARRIGGSIWLSESPDMIHWGRHRPVLRQGYSFWNNVKIGPTPPIKTPQGWLVIVHGVMAWSEVGGHYYIGAMLLDLREPAKVLGMTRSWLLAPEADYERHGQVNNVVFPCGAIAKPEADELWLYYGAADSCVGLATGSLSRVIDACLEGV